MTSIRFTLFLINSDAHELGHVLGAGRGIGWSQVNQLEGMMLLSKFTKAMSVLAFSVVLVARANEPVKPEVKVITDLHPLMYQMLNELMALQPFMVNEKLFVAKESKVEIEKHLSELSQLSEKVMVQKSLQSESYRVSGEALNQQIQHASRAFKSGNLQYARWALASVPVGCSSCHTQGVASAKPLWTLSSDDLKGTPIDRADFLFSTRNYEPAEQIYTQLIRSYSGADTPGGFQDTGELEKALKKKLTIWIRVRRDLKGAKASLVADLKNAKLPKATRELMQRFVHDIDKTSKKSNQESALGGKELLELARKKLPGETAGFLSTIPPELISYLWVSGLLYERLNTAALGDLTPEYLYWLAVVDLGLNHEFFFSLGNTYLRDCVMKYPRGPITARCYGEYELQMSALYSGSSGTHIPADIQEDLRKLKLKAMAE